MAPRAGHGMVLKLPKRCDSAASRDAGTVQSRCCDRRAPNPRRPKDSEKASSMKKATTGIEEKASNMKKKASSGIKKRFNRCEKMFRSEWEKASAMAEKLHPVWKKASSGIKKRFNQCEKMFRSESEKASAMEEKLHPVWKKASIDMEKSFHHEAVKKRVLVRATWRRRKLQRSLMRATSGYGKGLNQSEAATHMG